MKKLLLKLYQEDGKIRIYRATTAIRRILARISLVQFKKAYLKVSYGKAKCAQGCECEFYNDGFYTDKKELTAVTRMFWEETL